MRGGISPQGYTIVEVMIFVAISGLMFVMAAAFVSGKQATAQFRQGINDINTQIQQTINDVSNGFYPSNSDFSCSAATNGGISPSAIPAQQGTNGGCIFLGKVVQFINPSSYNIFTLAGRQFAPGSNNAATVSTSFADAQPVVIATPDWPNDLTQYGTLTWGLSVTSMFSNGDPIDAVGFFGSFSNYGDNGSLQSGAQTVNVLTFPTSGATTPPNATASTMISDLDDSTNWAAATPIANPNILICFNGGTGHEYGSLSIGNSAGSANGQRLTTSIQIYTEQPGWNAAGCS